MTLSRLEPAPRSVFNGKSRKRPMQGLWHLWQSRVDLLFSGRCPGDCEKATSGEGGCWSWLFLICTIIRTMQAIANRMSVPLELDGDLMSGIRVPIKEA